MQCDIIKSGIKCCLEYEHFEEHLFNDPINHPQHYTKGKIEVIEVIEDWKLNFNIGQVIKYCGRADHKGARLQDLEKAQWYLLREISNIKKDLK